MHRHIIIILLLLSGFSLSAQRYMHDIFSAHNRGGKINPDEIITIGVGFTMETMNYMADGNPILQDPSWELGNASIKNQSNFGGIITIRKNIWRWLEIKAGLAYQKYKVSFQLPEVNIDKITFAKRSALVPQVSIGGTFPITNTFLISLFAGYGQRLTNPSAAGVEEDYTFSNGTAKVIDWHLEKTRSVLPLELECAYRFGYWSVLINAAYLADLGFSEVLLPNSLDVVYGENKGPTYYEGFSNSLSPGRFSLQLAYTIQ